jgi:hypothetical protein
MAKQSKFDDTDLRAELNANFVAKLKAKWEACGDTVLDEMAEKAPEKLAILVSAVLPKETLIPGKGNSRTPQTSAQVADQLLQDVGCAVIDDDMRTRAIEAFDIFMATIERIKTEAEALQ